MQSTIKYNTQQTNRICRKNTWWLPKKGFKMKRGTNDNIHILIKNNRKGIWVYSTDR